MGLEDNTIRIKSIKPKINGEAFMVGDEIQTPLEDGYKKQWFNEGGHIFRPRSSQHMYRDCLKFLGRATRGYLGSLMAAFFGIYMAFYSIKYFKTSMFVPMILLFAALLGGYYLGFGTGSHQRMITALNKPCVSRR